MTKAGMRTGSVCPRPSHDYLALYTYRTGARLDGTERSGSTTEMSVAVRRVGRSLANIAGLGPWRFA